MRSSANARRTRSSSSRLTDRRPGIDVEGLEVVYQRGAEPAVTDLTVQSPGGQGLLVTGRRGSGKTSVLRALLGLVRASGAIEVNGLVPGAAPLAAEVGYGPQGRTFAEGLSPRRLVDAVMALRTGRRDADGTERALTAAGLDRARWDDREPDVEDMRRLSLACALAGDPPSLVLDDPWEFVETFAAIDRALTAGGFVVVATHDPGHFADVLGQTIVLEGGSDENEDDEEDVVEPVTDGPDDATPARPEATDD